MWKMKIMESLVVVAMQTIYSFAIYTGYTSAKGEPLDLCMDAVADNIIIWLRYGRSRLEMGLYYVHTRKWLSVVPRSTAVATFRREASPCVSILFHIYSNCIRQVRPDNNVALSKHSRHLSKYTAPLESNLAGRLNAMLQIMKGTKVLTLGTVGVYTLVFSRFHGLHIQ